jgi:hypothetical protein
MWVASAWCERPLSPSIPLCVLRAQSDARLVELARDGHERAFEALVHRYRKLLLSYCRRFLLSEARAEDALELRTRAVRTAGARPAPVVEFRPGP